MALSRAVVVVTVLAAASVAGWWVGDQRRTANPQVRVVEAIDGDTVVVAFGDGHTDTVRLLGVDTPKVPQHPPASSRPSRGYEPFRSIGACSPTTSPIAASRLLPSPGWCTWTRPSQGRVDRPTSASRDDARVFVIVP